MTPLWLVLSLAALGLAGGGATPVADAKWHDWAAYPGARELCSQHVTGTTMHITWKAYVSTDAHRKVIDFYVKKHGGKPEGETLTLAGKNGTRLSVHDAVAGKYPTCDKKPAKGDKTVIIVSQAVGPGVK